MDLEPVAKYWVSTGCIFGHDGVNAIHDTPALLKDHYTIHANPLLAVWIANVKHCFPSSTLGHMGRKYLQLISGFVF